MERFVDTHCHLNFNLFDGDLDSVIERAVQAGIERILMPGIDLETSRQVVRLSERHPILYAAVGFHPNDALSWTEKSLDELKELAAHPRVLAIGEIGLDNYRDRAPKKLQLDIFKRQLCLAAEIGKPVVIHTRQSLVEAWPILEEWQVGLVNARSPLATHPGVLHSFDGDLQTALQAVKHHFFIGISGPVTYKNAEERRKIVTALPMNGLLLETDAPFLAPQPVRGRRNEPAFIPMIAEKIAQIHAQPLHVVAETTTHNAKNLFGWS